MAALVGALEDLMVLGKTLVLMSTGLLEVVQRHRYAAAGRIAIDTGSMALLMALIIHTERKRERAPQGRVGRLGWG